jgi:hypothetical protein
VCVFASANSSGFDLVLRIIKFWLFTFELNRGKEFVYTLFLCAKIHLNLI